MSTVVRYTIEFLSDWHIGTGVSRSGDVDRLVARDSDGLPFVPAKSMTGMWRDAVERLQLALPDGGPNVVEELFGSQPNRGRPSRPAGVSVRPARYRPAFRQALAVDQMLKGSVSTSRSSTAIDTRSGTAKPRTLRVVEVARATSVLEGTLTFAPNVSELAKDIFLAASRLIEGVGAKRRRGLGRCTVRLDGEVADAAVQRLLKASTGSNTGPAASEPTMESREGRPVDVGAAEHLFHMDFVTELPVVIAREVLGNVVRTHRAPTGTSMLPAVTAVLHAAGIDARALVASGHLGVSDAVPLWSDHELLPMPLAFSAVKHDTSDQPALHNTLRAQPNVQSKQQRSGWLQNDPTAPALTHVAVQQRTHATIDDRSQRPTSEVGGVFTYEAISPLQAYRCTIRLDVADELADRAADALRANPELSLGTSRKDDYGLVRVTSVRAAADGAGAVGVDTGTLTVWCASDVIVLDRFLRPRPTAESLGEALCAALDLPQDALEVHPTSVRMRPVRRDAWQSAWGLPRPTLVAIGAGSVATYVCKNGVTIGREQVRSLQRMGVGERTAEGFGRVLLNPALLSVDNVRPHRVDTVEAAPIDRKEALTDGEAALLQVIAVDAHRGWVAARVAEKRSMFEKLTEFGSVSLTQLQAFRTRLDAHDAFGPQGTVIAWLNDTAAKRWPEKALSEARRLAENPDTHLWRLLAVDGAPALLGPYAMRAFVEAVTRSRSRRGDGNGSR